jgi:HEPN domain-containing protein
MQRANDWLDEARAELRAGRDLLTGQHWSWCCFTCQQAAEKALKALCEHFRTPQFGHNLNLLLQAVEAHASVEEPLRMACARLNRYYIPTRYPDAFDRGAPADQFFEADADQAVMDADEIFRFATDIIGSS